MTYKELFDKCNLHLVESDRKRDQVIAFYVTIVGAFIAFSNNSNGFFRNGIEIPGYFILSLGILGILLACIVIQYRKWHIRYLNSAKILNQFIVTNQTPLQAFDNLYTDIMCEYGIDRDKYFPSMRFLNIYSKGVEFLTFQAFLVVAFVPLYIIFMFSGIGFQVNIHWGIVFFFNLLNFLIVMNLYAAVYLYFDFINETPFALWVLPAELKKLVEEKSNKKNPKKPDKNRGI